LTSEPYLVVPRVSSEGDERKEQTMTRMLLWWGVAVVAGWYLLPASLEGLSVVLGGLAAEVKVPPLSPGEALKLVGGAALLAAMWRWTTPKFARGRSGHPRRS
jgi:hypothetical protein